MVEALAEEENKLVHGTETARSKNNPELKKTFLPGTKTNTATATGVAECSERDVRINQCVLQEEAQGGASAIDQNFSLLFFLFFIF